MKDKYQDIINILKSSEECISSAQIAIKMNISQRSVKTYIKDINLQYPSLILAEKKGYRLNTDYDISLSTKETDNTIPQTQEERVRYIIKTILNGESHPVSNDIYDIADAIYVSIATIKRDLALASEVCKKYNTVLTLEKDALYIDGKEHDKRNLMTYIYMFEFEQSNLHMEGMQALFPEYDVQQIKEIITDTCRQNQYIINGYAINNIVLDILISIDRIRHSLLSEETHTDISFHYHEMELAKEITKKFEEMYHITYNQEELMSFTTLLFSNLLRVDYQEMTLDDLQKIVGIETYTLAEEIIEDTTDYFLKNRSIDFFKKFTLHLSNLLLRTKTNHINNNLLTDTIKNTCPLLFDCAVNISNIIYKKTGFIINDDEIAYIALHIGNLLGEEQNQKLSCAFIVHDYYDFSNNLKRKLANRFSSQVDFDQYCEISMIHPSEYDLIISTYPVLPSDTDNYVVITSLLTDKDITNIEQKIAEIEKKKAKQLLINQLLSVTSPDFFYRNPSISSKEALIQQMVERLTANHYVDENYVQEVLYREHISSTCFNLIAVPHSLNMSAHKTMLSIALFDKPIDWGSKKVNLVILFAIHKDDKYIFHNIFDNLITLLVEEQHIFQVIHSKHYHEFIEHIISIIP